MDDLEYTTLYRGKRNYELSNHLGNVHVIITDKRISICDDMEVESFKADVLAAMDYYPFGMMMPDRQWYVGSDSTIAVNGFNGMRRENDVAGMGNSYTTEFRQLDPRLGRWFSLDPVLHVALSPYNVNNNSPLFLIDPNGDSYDDYGITSSGDIVFLQRTDDNFDRLYSVDVIVSGNAMRIDVDYVKKDLNSDGNSENDFVSVNDRCILETLSLSYTWDEDGAKTYRASSDNGDDIFELFKFASDNSSVEWAATTTEKDGKFKFSISTFHNSELSPSVETTSGDKKMDRIVYRVHSHPGVENRVSAEKSSMGENGKRTEMRMLRTDGDWGIVRARVDAKMEIYPYHVYFPASAHLYSVEYDGTILLDTINDHKEIPYKK